MSRLLAAILFLFEPFLAASLLLRVGPSLFERDAATWAGMAARVVLALGSVAAGIGLRESRPYGHRLAVAVLVASAAFAIVQHLTHILPTSVAPDAAKLFTVMIVLHHSAWIAWLMWSARSSRRAPHPATGGRRPRDQEETSHE